MVETWGGVDAWVNNAMATVIGDVDDIPAEEFRRVTEVTYLGQVHGTLAALSHIRRQGQGTIIQIGSALAYRSIPLQAPYCAAKAAARVFTDSLRCELSYEGSPIRIAAVHMPGMNTPQFEWARLHARKRPRPVAPVFDPQAAAETVFQAALNAPRELWVGRSTVQAVIGQMVMPGLLDRLLGRKAWGGQLTEADVEPARSDNLFEPLRAYNPALIRGLGFIAAGLLTWRALTAKPRER